ncbi:MAG: hypothetical protein ACM3N9_02030, partial [Syntrophothermus sp.]
PSIQRRKIRQRKRRLFLRNFRFLKFRAHFRKNRLFNYQLSQARENSIRFLAAEPVIENPPAVKRETPPQSFGERYEKLKRARAILTIRKKREQEAKKLLKHQKLNPGYIRYRKLKFLLNTGRLFKIDRKKLRHSLEQKILFAFRRNYLVITINSTAIFLLAYFFVYISKQLAISVSANTMDIQTIIYYFEVDFLIRGKEWTEDAVKIIFSMGPFITLMISVISLIAYVNSLEKKGIIKLFILWVFCHSLIQFLGEVMAGTLLGKGFGWVLMYLYFVDTANMIVAITAVIFLVVAGLFFSKNFLFTGNTYFNYLIGNKTNKFVFSQIVLPFLIGNIIILVLKMPKMTLLEMLINCSMILILLPAILRSRFSNELFFDEEPRKIRFYPWWILSALIVMIAFRIIFGIGVRI